MADAGPTGTARRRFSGVATVLRSDVLSTLPKERLQQLGRRAGSHSKGLEVVGLDAWSSFVPRAHQPVS